MGRFKKSLSQNFLRDKNIANKIVSFAGITGRTVLEIGPGEGILTELLLQRALRVYAVEKDDTLVPFLSKKFPSLHLIHQSILDFPLEQVAPTEEEKIDIVSNIPYNITKEIFQTIIHYHKIVATATLLVQKEVAEKFFVTKGVTRTLALLLSICSVEKGFDVPRQCFQPIPYVNSSVIKITFTPWKDTEQWHRFTRFIHFVFERRRKKLYTQLAAHYPKERIENAWKEFFLSTNIRLDSLPIQQLKALFFTIEAT